MSSGLPLREVEIIDEVTFPNLKTELIKLIPVKGKKNKIQYRAIVITGCTGSLGLVGCYHKNSKIAIQRATNKTKLAMRQVAVDT